jgi:hypothetical protein
MGVLERNDDTCFDVNASTFLQKRRKVKSEAYVSVFKNV